MQKDISFTQLAEDIENSDGVLDLTHDYIYNFKDENITITSDLIINGNNHVIDCSDSSRAFYIKSGTVTINNLTIINGSSLDGGAIYNRDGNLTVTNSIFLNCLSRHSGSAILNDGNLTVIDSTFIYCTERNHAIEVQSMMGKQKLKNCTFIH